MMQVQIEMVIVESTLYNHVLYSLRLLVCTVLKKEARQLPLFEKGEDEYCKLNELLSGQDTICTSIDEIIHCTHRTY